MRYARGEQQEAVLPLSQPRWVESAKVVAPVIPAGERRLLERCKKKDQQAWHELIETYKHMVYSLAYDMVHDVEEAEDVSQEVFVSAYRAIHSFRGDSRLSTWLYRITKNVCLNRLRQRERVEVHPLEEDYEPSAEEVVANGSDTLSPEQILLRQELRDWVRRKVDELPLVYRTAIVLCDLQEMGYQEAAKVLGVPVGTLKSQVFRGRKMLKEALEEYMFGKKTKAVRRRGSGKRA